MRKLFLLIPAMLLSMMMSATTPTITIDGDKSDWSEVPMLSEPGVWPMLKVLPAADAEMGTNALAYMMENTEDFDPTWAKYPKVFIDKDYNGSTHTIDSYWAFSAMGLEYSMTTGATVGTSWVSFPKAMSSDNKVFEIGFPATYVTDLDSKFGFAMYYNSGAWFCPDRSDAVIEAIDPANGFLYKTRSFTTVAGTTTLTTANVYAHQSMGEVVEYIDYGPRDNGYDTIRWAAFPINLTQPAVYSVTTNVTSTNAWKFEFWVVDVATNAIVAHLDAPSSSRSGSETSYTFGNLDLSGIPAGKYMLKVKNRVAYSTVRLNSIDLTYVGGETKVIPSTLIPTDVILSDEAWVDKSGAVDSILFTARGSEGHNSVNWAKWRVKVTTAGHYNFKANVYRPDGSQRYEIKVLSWDESEEFATNSLTGMPTGAASISTGDVKLEEGSYVVKVRNTYDHAKSRLLNVEAEYIGGAVQNMPGTTAVNEAWFSEKGTRADGMISFSTYKDQWVKWNIAIPGSGEQGYKVTLNVSNPTEYGHHFSVSIYEENDEAHAIVVSEHEWNDSYDADAPLAIDLGSVSIVGGKNYIVKVTNAENGNKPKVISVNLAYEGGAVITLPGTLTLMEAVLSPLAYKEAGTGYIHFTDDAHVSQVPDQWAKWNVQAATGVYTFTFNVASTNYGKYVITINDDANNEVYTHEYDHEGDGSYTSESIVLMEGNYTVLMQNLQGHSKGYITNIYATQDESIFVLSENQTDNGSIIALDGVKRKLKLMRSFTANKYYTLCIPIDSYDEELAGIFGAGYELWGISTAEQVGDEITLNFEQIAGNNFANSTPYIIKPTVNVENPTFSNHTFHVNSTTKVRDAADFVGTFYKTEIPAGETNLYLQNNDLFYNENTNTPIKGTRAWVRLKPQGGAAAAPKARIVLKDNMTTAIETVNSKQQTLKRIENGQVIIIRDGQKYNVMGVKLQ